MSSEPVVDLPNRLTLPSGGWASFRASVRYGARRQLEDLSAKVSARVYLKRGPSLKGRDTYEPESLDIDEDSLAAQTLGEKYLPLCYLLTGWSYDLPLPKLTDLSSLDEVDLEDGEFLVAEARRLFERLDTSVTPPDDRTSPTQPSSE